VLPVDGRAVVGAVRAFGASGAEVNAGVLWRSYEGEPVKVLIDCTDGETAYFVYPAEAGADRPPWRPRAGVIVETRQKAAGSADDWA